MGSSTGCFRGAATQRSRPAAISTRFFLDRRFDLAMSAFLGCLKEVTRFLQRDPSMRLPFKIEGDKVGGFSVRVQFNQDEQWTKALKFMLTDLKWIIAWVESRDFSDRGDAGAAGAAVG